MSFNLLLEYHLVFLRLKGGYTGSSESTLVKIPHCWKSHVAAHIILLCWTVTTPSEIKVKAVFLTISVSDWHAYNILAFFAEWLVKNCFAV